MLCFRLKLDVWVKSGPKVGLCMETEQQCETVNSSTSSWHLSLTFKQTYQTSVRYGKRPCEALAQSDISVGECRILISMRAITCIQMQEKASE